MVVTLKPGRFYGSGLPRPWFHADVKFSEERVDPPPPVLDPLLCWAREAHWSMGGLSFTRHRLQGRIEGSIKKLRAEAEVAARKANKRKMQQQRQEGSEGRKRQILAESSEEEEEEEEGKEDVKAGVGGTPSPRRLRQRSRRLLTILEEDSSASDDDGTTKLEAAAPEPPSRPRRKSIRKLGDEFDRVASTSPREAIPGSDAALPLSATAGAVSSPRTRSRKQTGVQRSPRS